MKPTIFLASDHNGFTLKEKIKGWLKSWGYPYEDRGAFSFDPKDDYPDFVLPAAHAVAKHKGSVGIVIGFNGQGEAVAANRVKGVRACVYYGEPRGISEVGAQRKDKPKDMLVLSRADDNTNVLSLAAGFLDDTDAKRAIKRWLATPFSGAARHVRRIKKIE